MKRYLKIVSSIICLVILVFTVSGCITKPVKQKVEPFDFSKAGITITLTTEFTEREIENQSACYTSDKVAVTILKEEKYYFEKSNVYFKTLSEYADFVIKANKVDSKVENSEDGTYFIYESKVEDHTYKYYARVYQTKHTFWLVQFGCLKSDFPTYELDFIDYANSVVINSSTDVTT